MSQARQHIEDGLRRLRRGDTTSAAALFKRALENDPTMAAAHNLLGVVAIQEKDPVGACRYFRAAADLDPDDEKIRLNLAMALCQNGDFESSLENLERVGSPTAEAASLYSTLARAFDGRARPDIAVHCLERLIEVPATPPQLLHETLLDAIRGRWHDIAVHAAERLIDRGFTDAGVYCNYGVALRGADRLEDAIDAFETAARRDPSLVEAPANLGPLYYRLGRHRDAIAAFEAVLRLQPENVNARARLAHSRLAICDWTRWTEDADFFAALPGRADADGVSPFATIFWPMAEANRLQVARRYAEALEHEAKSLTARVPARQRGETGDRIRIGYMSAGFGDHATAHLTRTMFGRHDRHRFHVTGFPMAPDDGSRYREDIAAGCDIFCDLANLSDIDAVRRIADAAIDILVDLNGYTRHSRPRLLVPPLAPIKVSYLGYPGTMGARFIDYLIGDPTVTPATAADAYAESLVLLPHTYQVNDDQQAVADQPSSRVEVGLSDNAVVFAAFNNPRKIEPFIFGLWMRILSAVPESVLWILHTADEVRDNLCRVGEKFGIGRDRFVFAPPLPKPQHLARLRFADLFLDTHYCSGHTTASDALWVGLPVIAYPSDSFAGRVAASLLGAMGRPDLIAGSADSYVDLAVNLARSPAEVAAIRADLTARRKTAPLFDTGRFVRNLERAYKEMWRLHKAGERPRRIVIEDGAH